MIDDLQDDDDAIFEARAKARLGSVLRDKYRLERVLGIGGMATVYAATHRNGKEVALNPSFPGRAPVPPQWKDVYKRQGLSRLATPR